MKENCLHCGSNYQDPSFRYVGESGRPNKREARNTDTAVLQGGITVPNNVIANAEDDPHYQAKNQAELRIPTRICAIMDTSTAFTFDTRK
jgi:hypothetical protein